MLRPCRPTFVHLAPLLGGLSLFCGIARAQDERILIDGELREQGARVVSLDGESLTIRVGGSTRSVPLANWSAMLIDEDRWRGASRSRVRLAGESSAGGLHQLLELSDGQRIFGELITRDIEDPESMLWAIPGIGEIAVPLERVARVRLVPASEAEPSVSDEDEVMLLNGDLLIGFVEQMGSLLRFEGDQGSIALPWSLVREVRLANSESRPAPSIPMLWLRDGSSVQVADLRMQDEVARGRLLIAGEHAPPVAVDFEDVAGISFVPDRLIPLSSLEILEVAPTEGRLFAPPPEIGDPRKALLASAPITLRGPIRVVLALPKDADRVGGIARLPHRARLWGDCELVISQRMLGTSDRELARIHLSGAQPEHAFSIELEGATASGSLVFTIESGTFGPVQDEVDLVRGFILLRQTSEPPR